MQTRLAGTEDAGALARMLHDFNTEFGEPTPGTATLESRVIRFIESGEKIYLLGGSGPDGFAQVSFNSSIWSEGPIVLIEELYVIPDLRRQGMGRALIATGGNRTRAARLLGICERTLRNKLNSPTAA